MYFQKLLENIYIYFFERLWLIVMQDNDSRRRAYIIIFIVLSLAFLYIANNAKSNHSLDNEDSLYTFDSDIDVVSDNDNTEIEVMEISDNDSIENESDDESDTGIIVQYGKRTSNETSSQDTNSKKNENAENGSEKIDDEALKEQEKIDEEAFVSSVEDTIEGIIGGKKDSESEAADNVTFRNDKNLGLWNRLPHCRTFSRSS